MLSALGGILMAKIMMPDDPAIEEQPAVMPEASHDEEKPANIIMAVRQGAQTGVEMAVAVGAMVLVFSPRLAVLAGLAASPGSAAGSAILIRRSRRSMVLIFSAWWMWLMGAVDESVMAGSLLLQPGAAWNTCSPSSTCNRDVDGVGRDRDLCAAVSPISARRHPERRRLAVSPPITPMIAVLGLKALLAGSLSNLMSAALAGSASASPRRSAPPPPWPPRRFRRRRFPVRRLAAADTAATARLDLEQHAQARPWRETKPPLQVFRPLLVPGRVYNREVVDEIHASLVALRQRCRTARRGPCRVAQSPEDSDDAVSLRRPSIATPPTAGPAVFTALKPDLGLSSSIRVCVTSVAGNCAKDAIAVLPDVNATRRC